MTIWTGISWLFLALGLILHWVLALWLAKALLQKIISFLKLKEQEE